MLIFKCCISIAQYIIPDLKSFCIFSSCNNYVSVYNSLSFNLCNLVILYILSEILKRLPTSNDNNYNIMDLSTKQFKTGTVHKRMFSHTHISILRLI